jgi:hypothetical protein
MKRGWRVGYSGFPCELCGRQIGRVKNDAHYPEQSIQRTAAPGRVDRFMRALVFLRSLAQLIKRAQVGVGFESG